MSEKFTQLAEVQDYSTSGRFQEDLNLYRAKGYGLHSWQSGFGGVMAVYMKLENVPVRHEGMRSR